MLGGLSRLFGLVAKLFLTSSFFLGLSASLLLTLLFRFGFETKTLLFGLLSRFFLLSQSFPLGSLLRLFHLAAKLCLPPSFLCDFLASLLDLPQPLGLGSLSCLFRLAATLHMLMRCVFGLTESLFDPILLRFRFQAATFRKGFSSRLVFLLQAFRLGGERHGFASSGRKWLTAFGTRDASIKRGCSNGKLALTMRARRQQAFRNLFAACGCQSMTLKFVSKCSTFGGHFGVGNELRNNMCRRAMWTAASASTGAGIRRQLSLASRAMVLQLAHSRVTGASPSSVETTSFCHHPSRNAKQ